MAGRFPFFQKLRILWRTFIDRRTPTVAKLAVIGGLLYGISPLDIIPDVIPLLGQMDDLGVIIAVLVYFLGKTTHVRRDLRRDVIDVEPVRK